MSFHFVDNGVANTPSGRLAIRRHVMKGKNAGRKIQGRGRKNAPPETHAFFGDIHRPREEDREVIETVKEALARQDGTKLLFPEIPALSPCPLTGSEFAYFSFPIQFTTPMRYLVYQFHSAITDLLYPYAFCRPAYGLSDPWFGYMVSDQAFLHCLLATTATFLTHFHKPDNQTLEATRHWSQAIQLVNSKLSRNVDLSDSTLAVVLSLAIHSNLTNDPSRGLIHFEGLQRILSLRPGGVGSLRDMNRSLAQKIYRTDIDLALRWGTPSRFGALGLVTNTVVSKNDRPLAYPLNQTCAPLRQFTEEIMALCRRPGKVKTAGLDYQNLLIWLWQGVLDFAPLQGERPRNPLDDLWQLGLLAFLTTVTHPLETMRDVHTVLLQEMLRDRVERDVLRPLGADYGPLRFWAGFMCGLLTSQKPEMHLYSHTRTLASELDLNSWEDAKACLQSFPWITVAHGKPGKQIWDSIMPPAS